MRILIAHSFYRLAGGEDRYATQQAALLSPHHDVHLLERRNEELHPTIGTAVRMVVSPSLTAYVEEVILSFSPDIVHLHNVYPSFGPAVHLAASRCEVPIVMTVHNLRLRCPNGLMFTQGRPCARCETGRYFHAVTHHCFPSVEQSAAYAGALWAHRFLMRLQGKIALFIAPTNFIRDWLIKGGISPDRITVIRNFAQDIVGSNSEPGEFGLYVGRLSAEKGVETVLRALREAGDPPFRVIGDGPLGRSLTDLSGSLGLKNTEFLGRLEPSAVTTMLPRSRFLVMPSLSPENCPLALVEAMSAGRPLLVSNTGGLPEFVAGGAGLACEVGDVMSMAQHIITLMRNDELCRAAGARSLALATAEFHPRVHLARLEAAYRKAAAHHP